MKEQDLTHEVYDLDAVLLGFVDMIASGYEWNCPVCGELNRIVGVPKEEHVTCSECSYRSKFNPPEHAYD